MVVDILITQTEKINNVKILCVNIEKSADICNYNIILDIIIIIILIITIHHIKFIFLKNMRNTKFAQYN